MGAVERIDALPGFSPMQLRTIRQTVAKDCNEVEFDVFIETAKSYGLNPFRREIYAIVTNKDKPDRRQLVLVTGIDGFRRKAEESGDYCPSDDEPEFTYRDDLKDPSINPLGIEKVKVTAFKGQRRVVGIAYWDEFAPLREVWAEDPQTGRRGPTGRMEIDPKKTNWLRMPRHMLAKCAEAQALRKGWPSTFSGLYAAEEMDQATVDLAPSEWVEREDANVRRQRIGAGHAVPMIWKVGDQIEMVEFGKVADRISAHLKNIYSASEVSWWRDANTAGLRAFWAESPSDANEVKKLIEQREAELKKDEQ